MSQRNEIDHSTHIDEASGPLLAGLHVWVCFFMASSHIWAGVSSVRSLLSQAVLQFQQVSNTAIGTQTQRITQGPENAAYRASDPRQ